MKNTKMMIAAILLLCMTLCLCACGGGEDSTETTADTQATEEVTETTAEVTEKETEAADNGMTTYTVTVVDEGGNPVPGAMVQLCQDTCYPGVANDQGVATFQVPEASYKVSFLSLPQGYNYTTDAQEFYFEAGSTELTIVLKAEA